MPSFAYLIVDMLLFDFNGTLFLITTNEHGDVQMFDFETGMFQYEFKFDEVFKFEFKKKKKHLTEEQHHSIMGNKDQSQANLSKVSE